VTSTQLVKALLDRINVYNPKVNCYITVMGKEALAQAEVLDAEQKAGKFRGPLHGIPIGLKDNIDTAGTRTTAASPMFKDRVPTEDADIVVRLKKSGAIIMGKLNLHEFALGCTGDISYFGARAKPLGPGSRNRWIVLGLGGGAVRGPGVRRAGNRYRRQHPLPLGMVRDRRTQANCRSGLHSRHHPLPAPRWITAVPWRAP